MRGIYCLHVAEHHATPLNMVPVPGVYLSAVARATRRMRLGPLVYLLPLCSPLRLIEEICMLDHLSYGRLEVGVRRGVPPFELKYHKVEHDASREIFMDAFNCISAGLTTDTLTYAGPHFSYEQVPIALRPLQQPHPAFCGTALQTPSVPPGRASMGYISSPSGRWPRQRPTLTRSRRRSRGGAMQRNPRPSFSGALPLACSGTSSWPIPMRRQNDSRGPP